MDHLQTTTAYGKLRCLCAADAIGAGGVQLLTFAWYDDVPTTSRCA